MKNPFRKKIGLVLGGGAAKGFAHIGVLKVLEENGIIPDMIAGSSIGAVIGAAYALNPNIKELEKISFNFSLKNKIDLLFPKNGIIKGDKIENYLRHLYEDKKFSDLKIPLYITATDLLKKQEIIFSRGDITKAVRASISIPGIFNPITNNERVLVDGGIIDNLPTEVLRKMGADIIITVNPMETSKREMIFEEALKENKKSKIPNLLYTLGLSIQLLQSSRHEINSAKKDSDIFIEINSTEINLYDFQKKDEIIKIGEIEAKKHISKIKRLKRFNFKNIIR